jgi:hypothetical protein
LPIFDHLSPLAPFVPWLIAPLCGLAIWLAVLLVLHIRQALLRRRIGRRYQTHLSNKFHVKRGPAGASGSFVLGFPRWAYPKRDGTADKRRSGNRIIRYWSVVAIDGYELKCLYPLTMYRAVQGLRRGVHKLMIVRLNL